MRLSNIATVIADYFVGYNACDLIAICKRYELKCNEKLDPVHSKQDYINSGLSGLNQKQMEKLAINIINDGECPEFVKAVDEHLEQIPFEISMLTRRNIIDYLAQRGDLEGRVSIVDFLNRVWDLKNMESTYGEKDLEAYFGRHMVCFDDLTYDDMFEQLNAIYISDARFKRLLEQVVNPNVRLNKAEQLEYVKELNHILQEDGVILIHTKTSSGRSIFTLEKVTQGVDGQIKNIIFASLSKKPDIVLEDSLSNGIKIIDNKDNDCLVYSYPLGSNGLSWHDLIVWWNSGNENYTINDEKELFKRLKASLDSEPEKVFMKEYYNYIHTLGNTKPALIPQVYCHYDPKSAKLRGGQVYVHQKMDFLMLLPRGVRGH